MVFENIKGDILIHFKIYVVNVNVGIFCIFHSVISENGDSLKLSI